MLRVFVHARTPLSFLCLMWHNFNVWTNEPIVAQVYVNIMLLELAAVPALLILFTISNEMADTQISTVWIRCYEI